MHPQTAPGADSVTMALDQQRNWDISMAENLEHIRSKARGDSQRDSTVTEQAAATREWQGDPIYLPDEILVHILSYTSPRTLASCCRLSRQWYRAAVGPLYAYPVLSGRNFDLFARTISPSINLHVRDSPLASLVKRLNMATLVHQGSNSLTARLLRRTRGSLEEFVAPQASFAVNCLAPLSKATELRSLDLSLVSESPPLHELLNRLSHLEKLKHLRLPRSAGFGVHQEATTLSWPPNLEDLCLSGGIDSHFVYGIVALPASLRHLSIEHCPQAKSHALNYFLGKAVRPLKNLECLKIQHMPRLGSHALDGLLCSLPQLKRLSVSVDYITPAIFEEGHFNHDPVTYVALSNDPDPKAGDAAAPEAVITNVDALRNHALQVLELTSSGGSGIEDKLTPIDIILALEEGSLPRLRKVRVDKSLHWHSNATAGDVDALTDVLYDASKRDWMRARGMSEEADVENVGEEGVDKPWESKKPWEREAGVWLLDR